MPRMVTARRALIAFGVLATAALAPGRPPVRAGETLRIASRPPAPPPVRATGRDGDVVVQFREAAADRDVERGIRDVGGVRARRSAFGNRYVVTLDAGFTAAEAVRRLAQMPEVEWAEHNGTLRAFLVPNDTYYPYQWHLRMVQSERTWDIQEGDPSVAVAVIDSGIAYEDYEPFRKAPDFAGTTFVTGYNVFTGDSHANDDNFHGTHVAGTVAEATNNATGAAGLAFRCALMPIKALDANGEGSFFEVAEGIQYAVGFRLGGTNPVKVINLSLGGDEVSHSVTTAVDAAVAAGITVVVAAGNDGKGTLSFPASLPNVISVGAVDGRKQLAPYSNWGPGLSVVAPGGDLDRDDTGKDGRPDGYPDGVLQQTFDPDTAAATGRYDDFTYFFVVGTSQAAPHVAAAAALLYQQGITSPAAVKAALQSTAEDLGNKGRDDRYGHGLVRPAAALTGLGLDQ